MDPTDTHTHTFTLKVATLQYEKDHFHLENENSTLDKFAQNLRCLHLRHSILYLNQPTSTEC